MCKYFHLAKLAEIFTDILNLQFFSQDLAFKKLIPALWKVVGENIIIKNP